jgi:hypothetical protein
VPALQVGAVVVFFGVLAALALPGRGRSEARVDVPSVPDGVVAS